MTAVIWFRRDLRVEDNPAWAAATAAHDDVIALFVLDPGLWDTAGPFRGPQLAAHLRALDAALAERGGRLRVVRGNPIDVAPAVAADEYYWNDDYTPYATQRDDAVAEALDGRAVRSHGTVVHPPGSLLTAEGSPYRVFTPFSRKWFNAELPDVSPAGEATIASRPGDGIPDTGPPQMEGGAAAAHDRLAAFLEIADEYATSRDRPDMDGTSRLSADLKFGTLSPLHVLKTTGDSTEGRAAFCRQICWRDFWAQVIYHLPHTARRAMRPEYDRIQWRNDPDEFEAWKSGGTGYPIIDAGMRQLASEGWMNNRVRMLTASFLVKDLLVDWRLGERHFRRYLVDGDVAQNVGNWQWVAGTGADAAPYFRVFNPVTQGRKFDPAGDYVRKYVPELSRVPAKHIHAPWEAPAGAILDAGVTIGVDYPEPIVDHRVARERVLERYQEARQAGTAR